MTGASYDGTLTTGQLRLVGALVAAGVPLGFAVAFALLGLGIWPFALLGVLPGLVLGARFGPLAARTATPWAAAFFVAFVGFFVAIAFDLGGALLLAAVPGLQASSTLEPAAQLGALLFWGAPVLLLGGIPGSLVISFTTVVVVRRLNTMRGRSGAGAVTAGIVVLVIAGSAAWWRVTTTAAAEQARFEALFEGPIPVGIVHANLSPASYEVVVRYPETGWEGVAESYIGCESGSGGVRLQPGWALSVRPVGTASREVLIAQDDGQSRAELGIFIREDGTITASTAFPGEADPRWQECAVARP